MRRRRQPRPGQGPRRGRWCPLARRTAATTATEHQEGPIEGPDPVGHRDRRQERDEREIEQDEPQHRADRVASCDVGVAAARRDPHIGPRYVDSVTAARASVPLRWGRRGYRRRSILATAGVSIGPRSDAPETMASVPCCFRVRARSSPPRPQACSA